MAGAAAAQPVRPIVTRHAIREMRRARSAFCLPRTTPPTSRWRSASCGSWGLQADAVANGAEAVAALESIAYDLVLMDVQMPKMDGLEATAHIRDPQSAVHNHSIPIVAMTAHAMAGRPGEVPASGDE